MNRRRPGLNRAAPLLAAVIVLIMLVVLTAALGLLPPAPPAPTPTWPQGIELPGKLPHLP